MDMNEKDCLRSRRRRSSRRKNERPRPGEKGSPSILPNEREWKGFNAVWYRSSRKQDKESGPRLERAGTTTVGKTGTAGALFDTVRPFSAKHPGQNRAGTCTPVYRPGVHDPVNTTAERALRRDSGYRRSVRPACFTASTSVARSASRGYYFDPFLAFFASRFSFKVLAACFLVSFFVS